VESRILKRKWRNWGGFGGRRGSAFLGLAKTCSRHFASMLVSRSLKQLFVFKTIFIKFVYQKHEKVIRKRHFCIFYQTMLPLHAHQHQVWKRKNSPLQRVSNAVS
jgi:hypothetical protein